MRKYVWILVFSALLAPAITASQETTAVSTPAFYPVPELMAGFNLLYSKSLPKLARLSAIGSRTIRPNRLEKSR